MTLKILNEIHHLIEEAWHMGFDPILDQDAVVVLDPLPTSGEDMEQREQSKSDLKKRIMEKEAEVRTYLSSLEGLRVMIDSKILGETIWIVGKKEMLSDLPPGTVGYFPQEVMRIKTAEWTDETLSVRFAEMVDHMVDRLSGEKKVFRDSMVNNIQNFLNDFEKLNISNDAALGEQVEQCRSILTGVKPTTDPSDPNFLQISE